MWLFHVYIAASVYESKTQSSTYEASLISHDNRSVIYYVLKINEIISKRLLNASEKSPQRKREISNIEMR